MIDGSPLRISLLDVHPVLQLKLQNFKDDYGLGTSPALVWQCAPVSAVEVDRFNVDIANALRAGSPRDSSDGWWNGFKSDHVRLTFDGLMASWHAVDQGSASEVHVDGHVIAGLWNFPEARTEGPVVAEVHDFHASAFDDFCAMATRVLNAAEVAGPLDLTCTMLNTDKTGFKRGRLGERLVVLRRPELQWAVRQVASTAELIQAGAAMGAELLAAYGARRRD